MRILNDLNAQNNPHIQWVSCEPEIHHLELRGKHFLFEPNSLMLIETSIEEAKGTQAADLAGFKKPYIAPDLTDYRQKMIVFQATYACNLACRYCFVRAHYCNEQNTLNFQDALRALETWQFQPMQQQLRDQQRNPNMRIKGYDIGFFGGEPLLNWELIYQVSQEVIRRAKMQNAPYKFHITTNGTLMTEEMAQYCAKNNFTFIVSLDGQEKFHNNNRPYAKTGKGGSWGDTMRGLDFIAKAYAEVGSPHRPTLRATYDKAGVDLVQCLEFLNRLCYEGKGGHVSVEPSSLGEGCSSQPDKLEDLTPEEIKAAFENEYWSAADWFLAEVRARRTPSFHHFEMMLQRLYDRQPAFSECGAGKGYISVGPGGKISACHRENEAEIGHLNTGGIDPAKQSPWLDNRYFARAKCPQCWQRNLCGGGCRHDSLQYGNCINDPNPVECEFKDLYLKPVLWLLSEMTHEEKKKYSRVR